MNECQELSFRFVECWMSPLEYRVLFIEERSNFLDEVTDFIKWLTAMFGNFSHYTRQQVDIQRATPFTVFIPHVNCATPSEHTMGFIGHTTGTMPSELSAF